MESNILLTESCIRSIPDPIVPHQVPVKNSCPWGQVKAVESVSLNDVMSEQYISSLVENPVVSKPEAVIIDDLKGCGDTVTADNDFVLAQLLQQQYDREHDKVLKLEESKYNGDSKVKVSYGKYMILPTTIISSDDEGECERDYRLEQSEKNHWHNLEQAEKTLQAVGRSGVSRLNSGTTTKHDPLMCGRRNAGRLMEFAPCMKTGDGADFDIKFSNRVYNDLRSYSVAENKRGQKVHDKKEVSTIDSILDEKTNIILFKLINKGVLDSLTGCVSTGKEASVLHAWSGTCDEDWPSPEFALKVFKTSCNEFKNRHDYVRGDFRFRYRFSKQNPRKTIHMWAEKEMRNLMRMKEANIPCPEVIDLKNHVLIMTFIGNNMLPAPKLKDVDLPFEDMTIIYEQTVEIMKKLYSDCKLVHADFSEYNLLWHDDKVWVIDVSQAVETTHPKAIEFLLRDCTNISTFFERKGVLEVLSPESLCFTISGQHPIKDKCKSEDNLDE